MSIILNKDEWRNFWKFVGEFKDDYPDEFLLVVSLIILDMLAIALIVAIYPYLDSGNCAYAFIRINR